MLTIIGNILAISGYIFLIILLIAAILAATVIYISFIPGVAKRDGKKWEFFQIMGLGSFIITTIGYFFMTGFFAFSVIVFIQELCKIIGGN